jgi:hypothetical protein
MKYKMAVMPTTAKINANNGREAIPKGCIVPKNQKRSRFVSSTLSNCVPTLTHPVTQ